MIKVRKTSPSIHARHLPSKPMPVFIQCILVFPPPCYQCQRNWPKLRSREYCRKGKSLQSAANTTHAWQDSTIASLRLANRWKSLDRSFGDSLGCRDGRLDSDSLEDLLVLLCWRLKRCRWCWTSDKTMKSSCGGSWSGVGSWRGCWRSDDDRRPKEWTISRADEYVWSRQAYSLFMKGLTSGLPMLEAPEACGET